MRIARMPAALSESEGEGSYRHRAFRWLLEREVTAYRPFYLAKYGLRSFYRLGPD